ncbi:F-box-like/WD repeat-containing protein TBL1X [Actinia tenebrosa]|uniref:F-box-like/WD repeat-containing protein TBL1X n=1 Tax=Actinia tenebrosa TaxID=6105 RepID=A0A6P8IFV2_ACTTE|nr:F-box-like/WD repeat-containing protein TBL1X [Actinia tenebrosa]
MSMSSDEVNFLVYRYLQESGFQHSAFTFGIESHIDQSNINGSVVPPGALVSVLQKGVQYVESEATVTEEGNLLDDSELDQLSLIDAVLPDVVSSRHSLISNRIIKPEVPAVNDLLNASGDGYMHVNSVPQDVTDCDPVMMDNGSQKALILKGHGSEVFVCSWNPTQDLLATGSGDGTARLWSINDSGLPVVPIILEHKAKDLQENHTSAVTNLDVTSLEWNCDGTYLASGSYDGCARIWNPEGQLIATLKEHKAPLFAIKWNKKGNYLVSAGVDKACIVWEANTWEIKQQFVFHLDPTLDVDWQNSTCFASCSTDKNVHICKIGLDKPFKTFRGHTAEINTIKWDPTGTYLASCSDDMSIKIWSLKHDFCIQDLQGHKKEIYTISWSPGKTGSPSQTPSTLLASGSYDTTVRLWDMEKGTCIHTFTKHFEPVTSLSFSPDGKYLASGSFDKHVHIWSIQSGNLVHTFQGNGSVYEVEWSPKGDKLAACFSSSMVCVLDVRSL